jgi:hypothetical protein
METNERLDHAIADLGRRAGGPASEEEIGALRDILHVEGFGGREDSATTMRAARKIAKERMTWLRNQRAEGMR